MRYHTFLLYLTFELPEDYPSSSPPSFTLTCSWLTHTQLCALTDQLNDLYKATGGAVVLFTWIQFLKEDALKFLDVHSLLELPSHEQSIAQDLSATSSRAERPTGNFAESLNPSTLDKSSKDCQVAEESGQNNSTSHLSKVSQTDLNSDSNEEPLIQNTLTDSDKDSSDDREADQTSENSEFKSVSEHLPFAQSDQSDQEDIFTEGDSSASSFPSSSSPHPLDQTGQTPSGLSLTPSQALLSQLLIYNATQKQKEFSTTVFDCDICFVGWLGSECVQLLECDHIFCRGCLSEFCKLQITEGNVEGVTCPNADCPATPTPAQVKSLVGDELFSRYDRLLLQKTLDSMSDVVYCPRRTCAAAVILEKSSRAAMCSVCSFAFCVACRKTYHGTDYCGPKKNTQKQIKEPQQLKSRLPQSQEGIQALREDYATGSKRRKRLLESRYGRSGLLYTLEERLSEDWLTVNSKHCPHCFCRIEKNGGCNMMICTKCRQRFCWACLTRLQTAGALHTHQCQSPLFEVMDPYD
uniref:RBR-type E3 ubiquitin transferase n=1 Tax=Labrus bergylta TaxID=56723 RepID=A0A3Q3LAR2_9LABR